MATIESTVEIGDPYAGTKQVPVAPSAQDTAAPPFRVNVTVPAGTEAVPTP